MAKDENKKDITTTFKYDSLVESVYRRDIADFFNEILLNIKSNKKHIDMIIDRHQISEYDFEDKYTPEGDTYKKAENLITELRDTNHELLKDSVIHIEKLLLELISQLFPHKTDSIFVKVFTWLKDKQNYVGLSEEDVEDGFSFLERIREDLTAYLKYLRTQAKELGNKYLSKNLFDEEIYCK